MDDKKEDIVKTNEENNDSRDKQQKSIEQIAKEICFSNTDYIGIEKQEKDEKIESILIKLYNIFSINPSFRPHYFFMFDLLENKRWNELITPIAIIKIFNDTLEMCDSSFIKQEKDGFYYYLNDNEFRYNVNMFSSALKYELLVRKGISKSEEDIKKQQDDFKSFSNSPNEKLETQIKDHEKVLKDFDDNVAKKIKETNENIDKKIDEFNKEFNIVKDDFETTRTDFNTAIKEFNDAKVDVDKTKTEMSSLLTNVLTILGIFVSIIFVIVGAYFTVTGEITNLSISNIVQVNIGRFVLMGHILTNLLFLFMFMIARLANKSIAVNCKGCPDSDCINAKCNFINRIVKRYPYIVILNIVAICSYVVLLSWWFIETFAYKYIEPKLIDFASSDALLFVGSILLITAVVIAIPFFIFYKCSKTK